VPIKYIGDGMLCFFSGTGHRERALDAARQMDRLSAEPLKIALATGPIYLGSLGHPDYAQLDIMGDAVNVVFRTLTWPGLEARSGIIAAASVVDHLEEKSGFGPAQKVKLTGIPEPVELYEVMSSREAGER
jgi:class 3 adenylate cyclase